MRKIQKLKPEEKYNKVIDENMSYLDDLNDVKAEFNIQKYKDPDLIIKTVNVEGINIDLSTDGLCGINKIIEFSQKEDIIDNYELIRKNNYLLWPAYAMSINQQRGYKNKCNDRIDLLMCDLQTFFNIINKENTNYYDIINEIQKQCHLYRAYLNMFTFIWLKSFGTFDKFIKDNNYEKFVTKKNIKKDGKMYENYIAENWTPTNEFDKKYFNELLNRLRSNGN